MKRLQNLSYKFLFTILFLALAGIVFFLKIGGKTQKVSATWWDDSWHYRQSINISSHTSLESNVYITTSINIGTTTKAQTDDGDFRFISQSGENLSYYIVSGAGTTNVTFNIQFTSFPTGAQTIYAYYGNSTVSNGFSLSDFSTVASNYVIGSLSSEEAGGGPIAYWKFDEGVGTTAYDSSSNKKNGTFAVGTSSPSWVTEEQCISGKCLLFDGNNNQSISLANLISSNSNIRSQGITVQAWVKLTDSNKEMRIISQSISSGYSDISSGGIGIRSNNKASFIAYDDSGSYRFQDSNTTLQTNQWYFITGTFNPSDLKMNIYINGKLDSSSNVTNTLFSRIVNNDYNKIGTIYQNGTNRQFFGYLDETKIYPYARTADQIKQDYNSRGSLSGSSANLGIQSSTAPDLNSSLVAYYKFKENNGTIVYDSITNTSSTLTTGPIWVRNNLGIGVSLGGYGSNDYIALSNQVLNNATTWSISTKLKYTDLIKTFEFFLGKNDQTTGKILLRHNGYISFRGTNGTYYDFSTTSAEINNLDSNLLFVSNGSTIKLYINGIYKSSVTPASTSISIDAIGNAWTDTVWTSAMVINELKIYNTALTDDQIKQDYNQGSAISFGSTNQTIGATTTSLDYCIPGDTTYCAPPIAEWKMDEGIGTSIVDISGNNRTGTLVNSPSWVQGKIGKGLSFNTNKYIDTVASNTLLNGDTSFTIQSWFKTNQLYTTADPNVGARLITIYRGAGSSKIGLGFYGNNTDTLMAFTNTSPAGVFKTNSGFNDNDWHYLSTTYDNSTDILKLFYDGIEVGSTNVGTISSSDTSIAQIGTLSSGSYPFNGSIDQVKIYNYARTPAQVAYDYNRGGPVGWWKMDECQGSTIYDWSGNGNNGTLSIGSSGTQNSIGTCQIGTSAAWTNGATGKLNSSLSFGGVDDYVDLGTSSLLVGNTGDITLSAWIKVPSSCADCGIIGTRSNKNDYTQPYGFQILGSGGVSFRVGYATSSYNITSSSIIDNKWHFITGTINNNIISLFLDGKYVGQTTFSGTRQVGVRMTIGSWQSSTSYSPYFFNGQIDDVRIYNYALTPEQIKQVYNGGAISFN